MHACGSAYGGGHLGCNEAGDDCSGATQMQQACGWAGRWPCRGKRRDPCSKVARQEMRAQRASVTPSREAHRVGNFVQQAHDGHGWRRLHHLAHQLVAPAGASNLQLSAPPCHRQRQAGRRPPPGEAANPPGHGVARQHVPAPWSRQVRQPCKSISRGRPQAPQGQAAAHFQLGAARQLAMDAANKCASLAPAIRMAKRPIQATRDTTRHVGRHPQLMAAKRLFEPFPDI